jgi:class 3 adenylate cyclase
MQPDWIASFLSDSETEARMPPESEAPRKAEVIDARPHLAAAKGSFGYRPVRQGRWNVGAMARGPGRRHLLPAPRPVTASPRFCLHTGPSYAEHNWGETHVERRLAAILVADVVGFSRLLGRDEEGTFRRLVAHRREVIEPSVDAYCGRIVKHTGDGLLAEFTSTVNAVRCAIAIQRRVAERNSGVTASERIELRIGISLGEVIVDGDDIFGESAIIAARLEGIAEPGSVYLSRAAHDQVKGKIEIVSESLGERHLKNIAESVEVYAIEPLDDGRNTGGSGLPSRIGDM